MMYLLSFAGENESKGKIMISNYMPFTFYALILFGLYLTSLYNYLLFHSLAEIFSIVVGSGIFSLAWSARHAMTNNYLMVLGAGYMCVSGTHLIHTLSYKGMNIFPGYETNLSVQLWIIARYMESLSFFIAPFFFDRKLKPNLLFLIFLLLTSFLVSLAFLKIFPACFAEGAGQTLFKKISEYIICLILAASVFLLYRHRERFDPPVFRQMVSSLMMSIIAELIFTFYVSVYDVFNLLGHLFKIISFYLIYKAIVETGYMKPYKLLADRSAGLEAANGELTVKIESLREAEEKMETAHHLLQSIIDNSMSLIIVKDTHGQYIVANRLSEELISYKRGEMIGKSDYNIFPKEVADKFAAEDRSIIESGNPVITEDNLVLKGEQRTLFTTKFPLFDERGDIMGICGMAADITDRKRAEEKLHKSAMILREAERIANVGAWEWDPEKNEFLVSEGFQRIHGTETSRFPADTLYAYIYPDNARVIKRALQNARKGVSPYDAEYQIIRQDTGEVRFVHARGESIQDETGKTVKLYGVVQDIHDRKQAEEERENLVAISNLFLSSDHPESNYEAMVRMLSRRFHFPVIAVERYDREAGDMVFLKSEGIPVSDHEPMRVPIDQTLSGTVAVSGEPILELNAGRRSEYRFDPLKKLNIETFICVPMKVKDHVIGTLSLGDRRSRQDAVRIFNAVQIIANHLAQEIKRRQAQEALKQERERLFSVLDILPSFVYLQKRDYTIAFANRSFRELFGIPENRPCYEVTHNRQEPCEVCPTFRVFDTKSPEIWEWHHKTGQTYMIYDDIFTDTDGTEMVAEFGIEITELKQAQEALRKSRDHLEEEVRIRTAELTEANRQLKQEMEEREYVQAALQEKQAQLIHSGRLASLGEMASGIAHELNQPLSIIRLYAESLKFSLKKAELLEFAFQDKLDSIMRSVDRAADIIEHMRGYARTNNSDDEKTCLSKPIENALIFFREQFRNHEITLETDYAKDLPKVPVNSQRFEQIAVNLLSNARYAVDKRGELEKGFQKKVALRVFYDKYKNSVVFETKDNGIGMDAKEKERCQEPFFTTKEVGEGTGLGLSIVRGIIREFKGTLEIESEKNIGTAMRVRVPIDN